MSDGDPNSRPSCLIFGGTGFIGRHLVEYLTRENLCERIKVVDKVPPELSWMNETHKAAFNQVEFFSCNLINPKAVDSLISDEETWDLVFNCAGETRPGQDDQVYKEGIFQLSLNCAQIALKAKAKRFVEISSGLMYCSEKSFMKELTSPSHNKGPAKEDRKLNPWCQEAKYKLQVENELAKMDDLNYVIVRPAIVYGKGDRYGITPRMVLGAVYKSLNEKMKMLWSADLVMNTVHVLDLVRGLWHLTQHGKRGEVYHMVDKGSTTQGKVTSLISDIFKISHGYAGYILSNLANKDLQGFVEDCNDKHMVPWATVCRDDGVPNTPLNPYLYEELLNNHPLWLDGSKLEKETGFEYEKPELTRDLLVEVLQDFVNLKMFPPSMVQM